MLDLRSRLTQQIVHTVRQEKPVLIVGGPKMGKSYLLATAQRIAPTVRTYDDASVTDIQSLLAQVEPVLMSAGVEHYDVLLAMRSQVMWVPLTNLTPNIFRETFLSDDDAWARSAGHPYLGMAVHEEGVPPNNDEFVSRCAQLLQGRPDHRDLLTEIVNMPSTMRPYERYARLDSKRGPGLKRTLDWLVCAGLVSRMIDGERPGIWLAPIGLLPG